MSGVLLVMNLVIAIAIMIALILIPKLNPAICLVIAVWDLLRQLTQSEQVLEI